ncbi:MAG: NAD-dependent epimerase/dehydratase family protein [Candidatus Nanopelagicales bacterium]
MRILVIGGTRFVGRHIAAAALARGHDVTLLHRTPTELFPDAEHVLVDRDGDLGVLDGREWDATIDVSAYLPRQVRHLADALDGRGGRYLVISSTSVYAEPAGPGFDESSPTVPAAAADVEQITDQTYGPLKVAVEQTAREIFGELATVVRPTYVIGPYDYTRRFSSWVERMAAGGEVLGPGNPDDPIQVIDARDLGSFVVELVEDGTPGTFHAVSPDPVYTFGQMLADIAAVVGPSGTTVTWVDQQWLLDQGESDAGIPLWGGGDPWILANAADPAAARAAGLSARSIRQSVVEIAEHLRRHPPGTPAPGLSPERETELLAAWHAARG